MVVNAEVGLATGSALKVQFTKM
jgi:hypothetical protein